MAKGDDPDAGATSMDARGGECGDDLVSACEVPVSAHESEVDSA